MIGLGMNNKKIKKLKKSLKVRQQKKNQGTSFKIIWACIQKIWNSPIQRIASMWLQGTKWKKINKKANKQTPGKSRKPKSQDLEWSNQN